MQKRKMYNVTVERSSLKTYTVFASNDSEAGEIALEKAQDDDFFNEGESLPEFETVDIEQDWVDNYYDEDGVPCFEFYKDNEQIDLYKFAWNSNKTSTSRTNEKVKILKDSDKTYTTGGKTYFDVNLQKGSLSYRLSDFIISYDNVKAPIYVKTHIDDSGINGQKYTSTATQIYQD